MPEKPFSFDERELNVLRKICTALYFITIYALMGMQLYRQFALHQPSGEWNDIAILITFNVFVLLGSVLYLSGVVNPRVIRPGRLIAGYVGFVLLGFAFTLFKYNVLLGQELSLRGALDNLFTVIVISGLIVLGLGLLAYLGSRRIEKQISE